MMPESSSARLTAKPAMHPSTAAVASPELWDFYQRIVASLEGERPLVLASIDSLRIPVEDVHREEWERRARLEEIKELNSQVQAAEWRLKTGQEALLRQATENDNLRAHVPVWESDLKQIRSMVGPRIEGLRFRPGALPERIGGFSSCGADGACGLSSGSGVAARQAGRPATSPVGVQYLPADHDGGARSYVRGLEERLRREADGHAAAQQKLRDLNRVEEDEAALMLASLQNAVLRVRHNRDLVKATADDVTKWRLRLQADHNTLKENFQSEVTHLRECGESLSVHLRAMVARRGDTDKRGTDNIARSSEAKAVGSHASSIMRARDDAAACLEKIRTSEQHSAGRTRVHQEQLTTLRKRYDGLAKHRAQEVTALREDIASLQRSISQCELLAARCVTAGVATHGSKLGGCGGVPPPRRGCCVPATTLEALALRPTVARLRDALHHCQASLSEVRDGKESVREHSASAAVSVGDRGSGPDCGASRLETTDGCNDGDGDTQR